MKPLSKTSRFAEALAEGATIAEAGAQVGWNPVRSNNEMQGIRRRLGAQAR